MPPRRMLVAGCDGYIAEPMDVDSFGATVRSYLQPPADKHAHAQGAWRQGQAAGFAARSSAF